MRVKALFPSVLMFVFFCAVAGFAQTDPTAMPTTATKAGSGTIFDIPATGAWMKVQSGKVTQWSAIPSTDPGTRIDLISFVENGNRTTYYLVRSACSDGSIASAVIKPGNRAGISMDCNGYTVTITAAGLDQVQKLPPEAAALLKR